MEVVDYVMSLVNLRIQNIPIDSLIFLLSNFEARQNFHEISQNCDRNFNNNPLSFDNPLPLSLSRKINNQFFDNFINFPFSINPLFLKKIIINTINEINFSSLSPRHPHQPSISQKPIPKIPTANVFSPKYSLAVLSP